MLDAICLHVDAQKTFSILGFQNLPETEIEKYRQHLECPECGGKAYYRKESIDGKAACFGSRYHSDACKEGRSSLQRDLEVSHTVEINQLISKSKELLFDFTYRKPNITDDSPSLRNKRIVHTSKRNLQTSVAYQNRPQLIGMEKALNSLMRGSDLSQSDALIEIDEGYKFKAKNLFVNFSAAEAAENSKQARPKMYWGTISHSDSDLEWLNPSDCDDVGIPIKKYKDKILKRFKINEKRDIEGAGLILFGKCFWNPQKNRKIIELWNVDRIFISKLED
jgi:hypothetical protein